jgi:hypothetical protein
MNFPPSAVAGPRCRHPFKGNFSSPRFRLAVRRFWINGYPIARPLGIRSVKVSKPALALRLLQAIGFNERREGIGVLEPSFKVELRGDKTPVSFERPVQYARQFLGPEIRSNNGKSTACGEPRGQGAHAHTDPVFEFAVAGGDGKQLSGIKLPPSGFSGSLFGLSGSVAIPASCPASVRQRLRARRVEAGRGEQLCAPAPCRRVRTLSAT